MFGKTTDDISEVLMRMQDEARIACRHDQRAMALKMADWMANDRRFDGIRDKAAFAREAMDARSHGRMIDLTTRERSNATGPVGYVSRNV